MEAVKNNLKNTKIRWSNNKSMTIVLCSKGYPGHYKKNSKIENMKKIKLSKKDFIYHAGTKLVNGQLVSNGGRVLNITSLGNSYLKIRDKIILNIKKLNWKNGFYRKDIGWKVITRK